mgnify:CR=1 FL=1
MATERSEFSNLLKEIKMSETYSEKILSAFDNWTKTDEAPFDITHIKNAKLPENTSLQRKMKQFVLGGGKPGIGWGRLKKEAWGN